MDSYTNQTKTMNKKTQQIKQAIIDLLESKGYKKSTRSEAWVSKNGTGKVRYKFQRISMRFESAYESEDYEGRVVKKWGRIASAPVSRLSITEEGKIKGLKR